jgi:hypothetical protein
LTLIKPINKAPRGIITKYKSIIVKIYWRKLKRRKWFHMLVSGWSDQRETVDEELPLTFSDTVMVRNFSRKAKKIWKKR